MNPNIRASLSSSSLRTLSVNAVVYEERWIKGKDNVRLLHAPSIESDIVWEARNLRFAYSVLRPKLGEPYSAETLISVFREHFPLGTQQSEHEAEAVVEKFRNCFNDTAYLSPLGFYNASGLDVTDKMHKTPRPANMCFLETKFDLPLSKLGDPFTAYQRCDLTCYLHLPQSLGENANVVLSTPAKVSAAESSASERRSLFSAATNLNSKFMSTPGRLAPVVDSTQLPSIVHIPNVVAVSGIRTTTPNAKDKEDAENYGDESDDTQPPSTSGSNHSFDKIQELAPKTAQLFANRRAHGGRSSRSYYGPLDILDIQTDFDNAGIRWNEMFHLGVNNAGSSNVVKYDDMQKKVKEMGQEIMFEVFCDRYQNAYVGALLSGKDIEAITVEQINKSLSFIKMQYRDNRTNELVTTTPDTVFKKMVDYVPLLPDDATKWSFCLPSMFYNSLTQEVKTEMQIQDYQIPQPSLLPTKKDQLQSMSTCRSMAGQAVRKVK